MHTSHGRQVKFERLEVRKLLAGSPFATLSSKGTLAVLGTSATDEITVAASGDQFIATLNAATLSFPSASVKRLYIDAGEGSDTVTAAVKRSTSIVARGGNDSVTVAWGSTIDAGDGNDTVTGSPFDDTIIGGTGDDTINAENGGASVTGGDGIDTLDFGDATNGLEFWIGQFPDDAPDGQRMSAFNNDIDVRTTDHFEVISATPFLDRIRHLYADDDQPVQTWFGRGGNDIFEDMSKAILDGGDGNDNFNRPFTNTTVRGGDGDDLITLSVLPASIDGGLGNDKLTAFEPGTPVIDLHGTHIEQASVSYTVIGDDTAEILKGRTVFGNGGNDTITGNVENNYLDGGEGDDYIEGGAGNDNIFGGAGNDILAGNANNDKIHGGDGDDTIVGGKGHDRLYGDAGDDQILARDRLRDTLYGGGGVNSATVDAKGTQTDLWSEIETLI